jgi:hypothetical protein
MATFSKPAESSSSEPKLPTKRKRTLTSKITDEDNVHEDAIMRRKLAQLTQPAPPTTSGTKPPKAKASQPLTKLPDCQPSVEAVEEEDDDTYQNADQPRNPNAILEEVEDGSEGGFCRRTTQLMNVSTIYLLCTCRRTTVHSLVLEYM